ncbi:MAG: DUF4173 domain-containing protein [Oscillospiraceae bacterium]|jgi:hypothetical protein|nr:DUF4173 domain-containing protein [Oscillospiraceae bacterium]
MNDHNPIPQPPGATAPVPPQAPGSPPPGYPWQPWPQGAPPLPSPVPFQPKPPKNLPEHTAADSFLALLTFAAALLFWRWGVWGGLRLGFPVACAAFYALVTAFAFRKRPSRAGKVLTPIPVLCGITALGLSAVFAVQSDPLLHGILFPVISGLTAIYLAGIYQALRYDTGSLLTLADAARILFLLPFLHIADSLTVLFRGAKGQKSRIGLILAGVGAAVPVLLISGALLASADAAFSGALQLILSHIKDFLFQLLLAVLLFFPLYSLLFSLHCGMETFDGKRRAELQPGKMEPAVSIAFLSALSLLYVGYLFSQLAYFFNAFRGILPQDYTVADYARRGFFEMCAVAALNLLLLLLWNRLTRPKDGHPLAALRALGAFVCVFTLLLIATAESKMILYIRSFGMTRLRIMTASFMLLLALAFLLLLVRQFIRRFPYMRLFTVTACLFLLAMAWAGVDRTVLRYNTWAYRTGRLQSLDVETLSELSDAKIPYLIRLADDKQPQVSTEAQRALWHWFCSQSGVPSYQWLLCLLDSETAPISLREYRDDRKDVSLASYNRDRRAALAAMEAYLSSENCAFRQKFCMICHTVAFSPEDHTDRDHCPQTLWRDDWCDVCGRIVKDPGDHDETCWRFLAVAEEFWCTDCQRDVDPRYPDTQHADFCPKSMLQDSWLENPLYHWTWETYDWAAYRAALAKDAPPFWMNFPSFSRRGEWM